MQTMRFVFLRVYKREEEQYPVPTPSGCHCSGVTGAVHILIFVLCELTGWQMGKDKRQSCKFLHDHNLLKDLIFLLSDEIT